MYRSKVVDSKDDLFEKVIKINGVQIEIKTVNFSVLPITLKKLFR